MRLSAQKAATPRYTLYFEWPGGRPIGPSHAHRLQAEDVADAKLEAAIVYACTDPAALPPAYRIVVGARRVVYRYPETDARRRLAA